MELRVWVGRGGVATDLRLDELDGPTAQTVALVGDQLTVGDGFHILCSDSLLPLLYHLLVT